MQRATQGVRYLSKRWRDFAPAADASVDVILSNCVINLSTEKERVFTEAYRVLRPGGRVMISDLVLTRGLPEPVRSSLDAHAGCIGGAVPLPEYFRLLESAGFRDLRVVEEKAFDIASEDRESYGIWFADAFRIPLDVVRGDFQDKESLKKALDGMDGAFVMGTPYEKGTEAEVIEGKAMIDACKEKGISHVVYSSVGCANKQTGIPHFDSKYKIEKHLKQSGIPYTILRPVWFMENFASPWYRPSIEKGIVSSPLHPKRPLQMVSVADIGKIVADAFTNPSRYLGHEFDIAGDEMAMEAIIKEISRALLRTIRYDHIPESRAEEVVGRDWALMFEWFNKHGYDVDIGGTRNRFAYYGIPLTSFRQYLGHTRLGIEQVA